VHGGKSTNCSLTRLVSKFGIANIPLTYETVPK
jgi:hypothetical protein